MTSQQSGIIKALVAANFLVLCCLVPAILLYFDVGGAQTRSLSLADGLLQTRATLATRTATRSPATPTKTLPTATLEAGWKLYPSPKDGFAVAFPKTRSYQDIDPATIKTVIQTLKKNDPRLASVLESQEGQLAAAGIKFYATDFASVVGGFATNSNLIHKTETQAFTMDFYVGSSVSQLEGQASLVSKPITHRRLKFPSGDTEDFRFILNMTNASNQPIKIATTQYLFLNGKESYTLTFSCAPSLESQLLTTFEKIGRSFRFVSSAN